MAWTLEVVVLPVRYIDRSIAFDRDQLTEHTSACPHDRTDRRLNSAAPLTPAGRQQRPARLLYALKKSRRRRCAWSIKARVLEPCSGSIETAGRASPFRVRPVAEPRRRAQGRFSLHATASVRLSA